MDIPQIELKLKALAWLLDQRLVDPRSRYFDPPTVVDLFERYEPLRDALRERGGVLFGDIPIRERPVSSGTTDHDGRGYIDRRHLELLREDIAYSQRMLSGITGDEVSSARITREGIFFAGQQFDALQRVREVFSEATTELVVVDAYVNEDLLALLTNKAPSVAVRILTKRVTASFKVNAVAFNKQYGGLSVRESSEFHDRFVIVDDGMFFHFGASLKDLGGRGFMFSRIEEPDVIEGLRQKLQVAWDPATSIVES
jgi:hypothetical protein